MWGGDSVGGVVWGGDSVRGVVWGGDGVVWKGNLPCGSDLVFYQPVSELLQLWWR